MDAVDELLQEISDKKFTNDVSRLSKIARIRGKVNWLDFSPLLHSI